MYVCTYSTVCTHTHTHIHTHTHTHTHPHTSITTQSGGSHHGSNLAASGLWMDALNASLPSPDLPPVHPPVHQEHQEHQLSPHGGGVDEYTNNNNNNNSSHMSLSSLMQQVHLLVVLYTVPQYQLLMLCYAVFQLFPSTHTSPPPNPATLLCTTTNALTHLVCQNPPTPSPPQPLCNCRWPLRPGQAPAAHQITTIGKFIH